MGVSSVVRSLGSGSAVAALLAVHLAGCHDGSAGTAVSSSASSGSSASSAGGAGGASEVGGAGGMGGVGGAGGGPILPSGTSSLLRVLDAAGKPLSTAVVIPAGAAKPLLTDGAGYLLLENLSPGRFSARVEHTGYAPAAVAIDLPQGVHGGTELRLLPLPAPLPFDAAVGAALDQGAVHVTIPPGAFLDRNGEAVTGPVEATIVPLDPTAGLTALPGPLEGKTSSGSAVSLESYGMAEVTVWQNGLPLQLAPGKTASLEIVLPAALVAKVHPGESIPAWWLDLEAGVWREDGAGVVQDSVAEPGKLAWVAQVAHFTWWNCDRPWTNKSCFLVHVAYDGDFDEAVRGQTINASGVSYNGVSTPKLTDADGKACVEIMRSGKAIISVGQSLPASTSALVTGSSTAGDCTMPAACLPLELTLPASSVCAAGAQTPCRYSGPPGTEGRGSCRAGTQYCNRSGTGWTQCVGEVLPEPESCATPFDDDCDDLINEEGNDCSCTPGETVSCYTGPVGTVGIGQCHGGTRTCASDGRGYGPCTGQVLPAAEDCSTQGIDEDCNGTPICSGLAFWSKRFGDSNPQYASATAVDGAGNVLLAGNFEGTVDFGGGPLTSLGAVDISVAKLDAQGNHLWSKQFGYSNDQVSSAVAVDGAGNVLLTGAFQDMVYFGGGLLTSAGDFDIFVAKLDAQGNHLWSKRFGDSKSQGTSAVAVDGAGNVLLTGSFQGKVDFGGGPLTSAGDFDIFVAKLDAQGNHLWSKRFGGGIAQVARAAAVDGAGNVLLTGHFYGAVNFGGGPLISASYDIFVAKLDAQGNHLWSKRFGDINDESASAVAVDGAGNVLLTGAFVGTVDFGGGPLTDPGYQDIFVVKLDAQGNHLWSKRFGDDNSQGANAVAVDGAGSILLTGVFGGTVDFGGGPLLSVGEDIFVAKLDAQGKHLWSKRFGDSDFQQTFDVAVDGAGDVLLTGYFKGTMDFGNGSLTSAGDYDIFLAKLVP